MDDTQVILSTKQVLFNFSISREQLRRWTEKGLQKVERGKFDLKTLIEFRDEKIFGSGDDEMKKTRLRRERAKARKEEFLAGQLEGALVSREEVLDHIKWYVSEIKMFLLGLNRTLPPALVGLDPREMGDVIKRIVRKSLENFQKRMLKIGVEGR